MVRLYRKYHPRGLEIVGLAYEVSGDTATDAAQVRRYRDKFQIPFPLLLAGINETEVAAATLPQLQGFTSFPTTVFLGRDGRVQRVYAGFYGLSTGAQHTRLIEEFEKEIERLLSEKRAGRSPIEPSALSIETATPSSSAPGWRWSRRDPPGVRSTLP